MSTEEILEEIIESGFVISAMVSSRAKNIALRGKRVFLSAGQNSNRTWVESIASATVYSIDNIGSLMLGLRAAKKNDRVLDHSIQIYEINHIIKPANLLEGQLLLKRQELAIAKLELDEIEALNLEKVATYFKLRDGSVKKRGRPKKA